MKNVIPDTKRVVWCDLLRIIASFFVVVVHVCPMSCFWKDGSLSISDSICLCGFSNIAQCAVPVFVMISGSFFLDNNKELPLKKLYKNIFKLIVAFIFWSLVYLILHYVRGGQIFSFSDFLNSFFSSSKSVHLWFLPMLIFLYIITPLLRKITESRKTEEYFLIVAVLPFIFNFVFLYFAPPGIVKFTEHLSMDFVSGYSFYFVLGHYISSYEFKKSWRLILYIAASAAFVFSLVSYLYDHVVLNITAHILDNLNICKALYCAGFFLAFKTLLSGKAFSTAARNRISKLSKITFGIYLVHLSVLQLFPVEIFEKFGVALYIPLCSLSAFLVSGLISYILNKIPIVNKYLV